MVDVFAIWVGKSGLGKAWWATTLCNQATTHTHMCVLHILLNRGGNTVCVYVVVAWYVWNILYIVETQTWISYILNTFAQTPFCHSCMYVYMRREKVERVQKYRYIENMCCCLFVHICIFGGCCCYMCLWWLFLFLRKCGGGETARCKEMIHKRIEIRMNRVLVPHTNRRNKGWTSADRSTKATLMLTVPRPI